MGAEDIFTRRVNVWAVGDGGGYKTELAHVNVELRVRIEIDTSLSVDSAPLSFDSTAAIRPFQVDLVG